MSYASWLDVVKKIADPNSQLPIQSPEVVGAHVCFRYIGDLNTRIGYLVAWCSSSKRGIHISRVKAPPHVEIVSIDLPPEAANKGVPDDIQFVSPEVK